MKKRNPFFVAAFPFISVFVGYLMMIISLQAGSSTTTQTAGRVAAESSSTSPAAAIGALIGFAIMLPGLIYTYYWAIGTARELRAKYQGDIPNGILLFIPLVNYYWYWKYSIAAEKATNNKVQAILGFILLVLLGVIGMAVLQDGFNKAGGANETVPQGNTGAPMPSSPMAQQFEHSQPAPAAPSQDNPQQPHDQPPANPVG